MMHTHTPIHPEYTSHLHGAPGRRHWPLALLSVVGGTAGIAATAFVVMIIAMLNI
ncbi:MAG: hypothetical protein JKY92_04855 [Magnetovibrio sp.]|nr:hypothetical protein [Magnetovibrio sp.]